MAAGFAVTDREPSPRASGHAEADPFESAWGANMGREEVSNRMTVRSAWSGCRALLAVVTTIVVGFFASSARAVDFEIQEATVEKGEIELEYRGAVFDGQPKQSIVEEVEEEDEEEAPLDNAHDVELQMGLTERFMLSFTAVLDQPVDETFRLSVAEVEAQYELMKRQNFALSAQFEYEFATISSTPDELSLAALIEHWSGPFRTTANLFVTGQAGEAVETDGAGFEYALQSKRDLGGRWGLGVEAFGEIEDLANPGSFEDQEHYVGPMLYFGDNKDDDETGGDHDDESGAVERQGPKLSLSAGVLFGLTDITSDVAYRLNAFLEF